MHGTSLSSSSPSLHGSTRCSRSPAVMRMPEGISLNISQPRLSAIIVRIPTDRALSPHGMAPRPSPSAGAAGLWPSSPPGRLRGLGIGRRVRVAAGADGPGDRPPPPRPDRGSGTHPSAPARGGHTRYAPARGQRRPAAAARMRGAGGGGAVWREAVAP